jgi:hypothetical protein
LSGGHSGNLVSRTLLSWISGWFAKYTRTYDQRVAGLKKVAGRKLLVCLHVDFGSRLCENYFFSGETKYWFVRVAVTAKIIRLRYLPVSIIARKVSPSEFSHSLGQSLNRASRSDTDRSKRRVMKTAALDWAAALRFTPLAGRI